MFPKVKVLRYFRDWLTVGFNGQIRSEHSESVSLRSAITAIYINNRLQKQRRQTSAAVGLLYTVYGGMVVSESF